MGHCYRKISLASRTLLTSTLRLSLASLNQTPLDWKGNFNRINQAIQEAENHQADILLLPEMCITGYGCEDLFFSDHVYAKSLSLLQALKKLNSPVWVFVGLPYRKDGKSFNAMAALHQGEIKGIVAKKHLANDGIHYEYRWFQPWPIDLEEFEMIDDHSIPFGSPLFTIKGHKVMIEICEDSWQGDKRPAECHVHKGADIILNASASHFSLDKYLKRQALVLESSIKYNCLFAYTNITGNEAGRAIYDGDRMVAYKGNWVHINHDLLALGDVHLSHCEIHPEGNYGSTPRLISQHEQFSRAVSLGLYDYMRKSKGKGFTLSLSGGADSAATAVLVDIMYQRMQHELGISKPLNGLVCAYQATQNSSKTTYEAAKTLTDSLSIPLFNWNIDPAIHHYTQLVNDSVMDQMDWERHDLALQNIQSRSRAPGIWMLANYFGHILLTTGNRSEADVGYATMDGDTSGGLAPLAGIDKHFIRKWLKYALEELKYSGLSLICNLEPTAELRPLEVGQTDEEDLMPYALLVEIERLAIEQWYSPKEVYTTLVKDQSSNPEILKAHVVNFFRLWGRNQWKRERMAPSFHLDTFSVDPKTWCRFPILNQAYEEEIKELESNK